MKAKVLLTYLLFILGGLYAAAQPPNDIFDRNEKMVWLGLDFTAAKFVGDRRGWGSPDRTQHIIADMNKLMIRESEKFNIAYALNRRWVDMQIDVTLKHNKLLDMGNAVEDRLNGHFLDRTDIEQIVSLYDFGGLSGTGILFIVEAFNKPAMESVVWVTFVNLETKEVLLSKKMMDEPAGFGVRNFWAGSIYKMLKQIKRRDYGQWRREYARRK